MFKKVEYQGFEHHEDMRRVIEREVMPLVQDELGASADRISLRWKLRTEPAMSQPAVELEMDDDWAGKAQEVFLNVRLDYTQDAAVKAIRWCVRDMHGKLLDDFLRKQVEQMKRDLAEVGEA